MHGIPYVTTVYAPTSLPSPDLPPRPDPGGAWDPRGGAANLRLWEADRTNWSDRFLARMNENRAHLGLAAVDDAREHILGDPTILAADAVLGPAPARPDRTVVQTGAWILADEDPLPADLVAFLDDGPPPIYVGFGSMPAPQSLSTAVIEAVRAAGRRAIVARGWGALGVIDDARDGIAIGEVNHQALFPRVAAVVHHGGAGTTTAARAGTPQVVLPMFSDQFYWASRVVDLAIGASATSQGLTADALGVALDRALQLVVAAHAHAIAQQITLNGAEVGARRIVALFE